MIEKYLDSEELKRLTSILVVVIGCLIIAALFGILVVPGLRNANRPATPTGVSPVVGETGWLDPTEGPAQKGRVILPVDPQTLIDTSPELIARGKALYGQHCSTCHGEFGKGNGPAAGTMNPEPRDFTASEGWVNGRDMCGTYITLQQGIPGSSMAAFDYLAKKDRMAIVHCVQSLGDYSDTNGSPDDMQALREELASPGEKTNNKIPVSMAITKLEEEYVAPVPLLIPAEDKSPEAAVLRRAISDGSRAAQVLSDSAIWRSGPDALARSILPDAVGNGFSTKAATFKPDEWETLYNELMKRMPVN